MAIPKHDDIRVPALLLLSENETLKLNEFEIPLAESFGLSEEEISQEYESGNGKIFYDRISWALSYMNMAGLVQKPKRGIYKISSIGIEKLRTPENINVFIAAQIEKRKPIKKTITEITEHSNLNLTPQEELYDSSAKIRESIYSEIIDVILNKSPREFEKLVVGLLQRMGYGGEVTAAGEVTRYTNDKGIDGIIKEDVLGLGRIHIQAKRYARKNTIGREEIQKFVGALAVAQSNKGIFITTSSYKPSAIEYAENLNGATTVVLIDGGKLAEYIYDYGLGMQVEQTIEIKKLDSDYWDSMDDDAANAEIAAHAQNE
ncbi:MAG: restriction endonuclease [Thermoleophilia bacterium]